MKRALALVIFIIIYGSLYPFDFVSPNFQDETIRAQYVDKALNHYQRSDNLANILLYIPLGFLLYQILKRQTPALMAMLTATILGFTLSLIMEMLQLFLPRGASLSDLFNNSLGTLVGSLISPIIFWIQPRIIKRDNAYRLSFPFLVVIAWYGFWLFPWIPTFDFQQLKNALKPLIYTHGLTISGIFSHAVIWCGIISILAREFVSDNAQKHKEILIALAIFFFGKLLIVDQSIDADLMIVLMLMTWLAMRSDHRWMRWQLVFALATMVYWSQKNLDGFSWDHQQRAIQFIPFKGFITGNRLIGSLAMLEKLAVFGLILVELRAHGLTIRKASVIIMIWLFGLELLQSYTINHTPEITDPIIAMLLGVIYTQLEKRRRQPVASPKSLKHDLE